eukprot:GCRY01001275.1.p1 GENE.GCRY01001275.1~~GCRY01001275.1.p1  ORF type:complete len:668 (+),score=147.45 GCRY01001275.1:276-2006(+)
MNLHYVHETKKGMKGVLKTASFFGYSKDTIKKLVNDIFALIHGFNPKEVEAEGISQLVQKQHYAVILNPVSGNKRSIKVMKDYVEPVLTLCDFSFELLETERANHAVEIAKNLDLDKISALLVVGGDGTVHEALQGLYSREDWRYAVRVPFAHIPAGSGNGIAFTSGMRNPLSALAAVVQMNVQPTDVFSVFVGEERFYATVNVLFGLLADIDFESERFRYLGDARFTIYALIRAMKVRQYKCQLWSLPKENDETAATDDVPRCPYFTHHHGENAPTAAREPEPHGRPGECAECWANAAADEHWDHCTWPKTITLAPDWEGPSSLKTAIITRSGPPAPHLVQGFKTLPDGWRCEEGDNSVAFSAGKVSHFAPDINWLPGVHLSDGYLDLTYSPRAKTADVLKVMLKMETGAHLTLPVMDHWKSVACYFVPDPSRGNLGVDGEHVQRLPVALECHRGLGRLLCPRSPGRLASSLAANYFSLPPPPLLRQGPVAVSQGAGERARGGEEYPDSSSEASTTNLSLAPSDEILPSCDGLTPTEIEVTPAGTEVTPAKMVRADNPHSSSSVLDLSIVEVREE